MRGLDEEERYMMLFVIGRAPQNATTPKRIATIRRLVARGLIVILYEDDREVQAKCLPLGRLALRADSAVMPMIGVK